MAPLPVDRMRITAEFKSASARLSRRIWKKVEVSNAPLARLSQGCPGREGDGRCLDTENARAQGDRPPTMILRRGDFLVCEPALWADGQRQSLRWCKNHRS